MMRFSVVLPCHNEGLSIEKTLKSLVAEFSHHPDIDTFEIVVSEDGSTDDTRLKVEHTIRTTQIPNGNIRLLPPASRQGYSRGVLRGLASASQPLVLFTDSDGQYVPRDLVKLARAAESGYLVVGVRTPRNDPRQRRIFSSLFRLAYRCAGGPKVQDPSSPLVCAYAQDLHFLGEIQPKLSYGFWWEFQMRASIAHLRLKEIAIEHRERSSGTTQVYKLSRLSKIVITHLVGLAALRKELKTLKKRG